MTPALASERSNQKLARYMTTVAPKISRTATKPQAKTDRSFLASRTAKIRPAIIANPAKFAASKSNHVSDCMPETWPGGRP